MPQTVLGIDIGSYSIKISRVERGFGDFKLLDFFEVPLVAEEVLSYEESAGAALIKFLQENQIPYDTAVVSVPGQMCSFHQLTIPFGNLKKVDQALEFELETVIPFEIEDIIFDYLLLENSALESKVFAAYLKKEDFSRILDRLKISGFEPRYMGMDTADLAQLTLAGALPPQGRFGILDLGHSKANLVLLEGNQLKSLRCFSWGGHQITQAIAQTLNIAYDQAEQFKHERGQLQEKPEEPVYQVIRRNFEDLMQQLKQTLFAFYESGGQAIEALYLCGGTSRITGIEAFFSNQLKINVSSLDLLDDSFSQVPNHESIKAIIPNSFAMALRAVFPNKGIRLNFRQGEFAYKKDIEQLGGVFKRIGLMAGSVAVFALVYFIVSYHNLSSQVDKMNKNMANLIKASIPNIPKEGFKGSTQALTFVQGRATELEEKLKKVQGSNALGAMQILKMISAALPARDQLVVDIDDLKITQDRVHMEGRTVSYEGVDKVKSALQKVTQFKNVESGNVRKGVRDEIKFSMSFDISG